MLWGGGWTQLCVSCKIVRHYVPSTALSRIAVWSSLTTFVHGLGNTIGKVPLNHHGSICSYDCMCGPVLCTCSLLVSRGRHSLAQMTARFMLVLCSPL